MADLMDVETARGRMLALIKVPSETEDCALEHALGRVAAADLQASVAVPPFANSAMDGYAVRHDDPALERDAPLTVIDRSAAGHPAMRSVQPGTCVRIFTGAVLPDGADAVIAQEDAETIAPRQVRFRERTRHGRFVREVGSDIARGDRIIARGTRLGAAHLGVLAATGNAQVTVFRRPRISVITTGDELRPPGDTLAPGQIHDTSRFTLPALLPGLPVDPVAVHHAPDDPQRLLETLEAAAAGSDALICAGGVSVGDADHVRPLLDTHGRIDFWRLAIKPGKPFAFGHFRGRPLFGLPGNPVSSLVTFLVLVRPALEQLAGLAPTPLPQRTAVLAAPLCKAPGRRDFQRGRWVVSGEFPESSETAGAGPEELRVIAFERQDSNVLSGVAMADCLIDLPREAGDLPAGTRVRVIPLAGLLG